MKVSKQVVALIGISLLTAIGSTSVSARDVSSVLGRGGPVLVPSTATAASAVIAIQGRAAVEQVQGRAPVTLTAQRAVIAAHGEAARRIHVSDVQGRAPIGS